MATYYPNVSYPRDYLSTPCLGDQKSTPIAGTPPHPSSSPMYLSQPSSSGAFSVILSGSSLNGVAITSVGGRNEMSFLPTTSNCENLQSVDEQLSVQSSHVIHNHVGLDPQNFQSQGLSLSLGTQIQSGEQLPSFQYQFQGYPSMFSNFVPFSAKGTLNLSTDEVGSNDMRNFESIASGFAGANGSSTETEALSHLQYSLGHKVKHSDIYHYGSGFSNATILNTKYLTAARELLDEVVNINKALAQPDPEKHQTSQPKPSNGVSSEPSESITNSNSELSPAERKELQNKKTKLMAMLDELDRRYRQYYHQMKIVVTSFDGIAGPGAAKPYTALAVQTISRHFRSLRDTISGQIQVARKSLGEEDTSSNSQGVIPRLRYVDHQLKQQRALQQLGVLRHAWRPQRGLPESSVSILRAWLFEHFLHPYPKDSDKSMLAKQTGLTRNQVANWFINARVRLWKPMIEDMYKEEFGEKDENSKSSLEKAEKPPGEDSSASDDRKEDLQDSMTSKASDANCVQPGTIQGLNFDHIPNAETHGHLPSHAEVMRLRVIQGPKMDSVYPDTMLTPGQNGNNSFMAGAGMYDLTELGGFAGGNQVSLALGLQHQQNNAFHLSANANMQRNNTVTSASEPDTVDFHRTDPANEQNRPMYYMIL